MADDVISVKVKLREAARFVAEAETVRKSVDRIGDSADKTGRKTKKAEKQMNIFSGTIGALRVVALVAVAAIGLLAQPVGALALGIVGLLGSLGSLAGLLGTLPAFAMLGAQAFGVLAFSFGKVLKAVGPLDGAIDPAKFAALSRPAQDFALALDAMKGPLRDMQSSIQAGLFPGLTRGLIAARPALTALKGPLTDTGKVLGGLGERLGKLVGSRGFVADLTSQAKFNNVQLKSLGGAGLHLVNVFRNLMVGSRGLVGWIVKLAAGWARTADTTVASWRASGKLADMFHTVQVTTSRVGRILWRLGAALFNIGRMGKTQIGDGLLVWLLRTVTAFERWTASPAGVDTITKAFASARDTLRGVAAWMTKAGGAMDSTVIPTIMALTDALRPILSEGSGGFILGMYANGLRLIATAAGFIVANVPGASGALAALFAVLIVNKLAGFNVLAMAIKGIAATALFATAPMAGLATAFWAINAAVSPWALVAAAIIAVGVAFYLAYTKITPFRDAVDWLVNRLGDLLTLLKTMAEWSPAGLVYKAVKAIIPGMATGGVVNSPLQMVGERGPELAALPVGSRVFTAPQTRSMLRSPRVASVRRSEGGGSGGGGRPINVYSTLKVDRKVLAKAVETVVTDERAGG